MRSWLVHPSESGRVTGASWDAGKVALDLRRISFESNQEKMRDYQTAYRSFSLGALERRVLHGSLDRGLNACVECCDRWIGDGRVGLEWIGRDGSRETLTFAALQQ